MSKVPIYNPNKSISNYINKCEKYLLELQKEKYKLILQFVNEWLNKNLKSLSEFKYINEKVLIKNPIYNIKMLKKYIPLFNETFEIILNIPSDFDENIIHDKYIVNLLNHMLKFIKYDLVKYKKNNNKYYTIKLL